MIAGCSTEPTFVETGRPESKIVVLTDAKDNCSSSEPVKSTFATEDSRTKETSWFVEGKTGIGGKIPVGFLMPSLDIEAAITGHYGSKETRTWVNTFSDEFTIPAQMKSVLAVYFQETTQTGIINFYNKQIEYTYPAQVTRLGWDKVDIACGQPIPGRIMCADMTPDAPVAVPPSVANLAGKWQRSSPDNGEIAGIDVEINRVNISIYVQTDGSSGVADWGAQYQCVWSDPMEVTFKHLIYKTTTLTLHEGQPGELRVTAVDRYTNPPVFIPAQTTEYTFTKIE
jgi:hypothetical protein